MITLCVSVIGNSVFGHKPSFSILRSPSNFNYGGCIAGFILGECNGINCKNNGYTIIHPRISTASFYSELANV